ncbi:Protein of unknown function DUF262 [Sorangium cellulosum So ce56]|uniref:GmrSD restriction endonucleases N-terminal domain-containing protein n=2 Tax=Sorangium cellulosum TaxID=56 RepID=A9FID9_SORC5|nr:Protein of unknown function DUF262 [Sorangium cellulosum So ce56]
MAGGDVPTLLGRLPGWPKPAHDTPRESLDRRLVIAPHATTRCAMTTAHVLDRELEAPFAGREDDLLEKEEEPSPDETQPRQPASWPLQISKVERSIFELHRSWKNGVLRLDPDFQREFVWDYWRQVKLVESVLMRLPLPVFYLSEENEEETLVIDGQQRLTTLFSFLDGEFRLSGLKLLPELNQKHFKDLDGKVQRRFENTPLTCFIIQPGTDEQVKFQIFERVNEGAVALNAQEIRNCLYRGPGLDFIKHLANDASPGSFRDVAGPSRVYRRMRADELVLRAVALLDLGVDRYPGELKSFLNDELKRLNASTGEERDALAHRLKHALAHTKTVFEDHAFCRYKPSDGSWARQLNGPLVEVIVAGFDRFFPAGMPLPPRKIKAIRDRFRTISGEEAFRDAITFATQSTNTVRTRFDLWMKELAHVA